MTQEVYSCQLDPITNTILKIYLFRNVQNVEAIRSNIISGAWSCAIVKPSLILDPFQIAVAANKAAIAQKQGMMVTRTVYAELLFNLSLSKNITQSLNKFGVERDQNMLVCFLITPEVDVCEEILPQIEGERCSFQELPTLTSIKDVKQVYKLNELKDHLLDVVVSKMVTKSFVSHYINFVLLKQDYFIHYLFNFTTTIKCTLH